MEEKSEREGLEAAEEGLMEAEDNGIREMKMSIAASTSMFPGFRFSPTDNELISYYLKKKLECSDDKCVQVISEVEICRHEPWDLPLMGRNLYWSLAICFHWNYPAILSKAIIQSDNEWFFFSPRGRKYPNGSQSRRATQSGYWKATGRERNVKSGSRLIGTKRTLVFHVGRAPKGERTEWIMHEYCMHGKPQDSMVVFRLRKNSEFRLNDNGRKGSHNQRQSSNGNDSSEAGVDPVNLLEGSGTKACSSSNNSHSVEQIDSESDIDEKLGIEYSPHSSSSKPQDFDAGDDCFADILNDDIVKLDEPSLPRTPDLRPMIAGGPSEADRKSKQPLQETAPGALPFQGTANRRLRLLKCKGRKPKPKQSKLYEGGSEGVNLCDIQQPPKCVLSMFYVSASGNGRAILVISVILIFLVLVFFVERPLGRRRVVHVPP